MQTLVIEQSSTQNDCNEEFNNVIIKTKNYYNVMVNKYGDISTTTTQFSVRSMTSTHSWT